MVLRLLLFTLVIAIALIACVSCAVDPVIRAPLTCENDVIDKFAKDDRLPIPKNNISLVPLELQLNALEFLNDRKVMQLSKQEVEYYTGAPRHSNLTPYLIQACFVSVAGASAGPIEAGDADRFYAGFNAASFDPVFISEKRTLIAYSFGLAPRKAKSNPIAVVIWNDQPIERVMIAAFAAS